MDFIGDLHIHSHFSMATSKQLRPEYLDYWARIKGIKVVGTGDFTHPGWLREMKEKLEPAEPGLFKVKEAFKLDNPVEETSKNAVRFLLTAEISNIYKKNGQVRKIHSVLLAPDFETVEKIQQKLSSMNFNITSDGRPILGLDVRDLLEISLEANEDNFFIPAHIWTPWFSVFGSKSGFDAMEECFGDLTSHIHAVETGLSTDPPLNWMCSFLDRYTLVSNSDAHSPEKLGRNANLFKTEPTYRAIVEAMKTGDPQQFGGTFDMFPQEGKYHYDGHRKCGIRWDPVETMTHQGICPVCGKKITVGVVNRIVRLSDRQDITRRQNRLPYYSIIPLKEILSEIEGVGEKSKKITRQYEQLIRKAGSEFNLLQYMPVDQVRSIGGEVLAEAIRRMRNNEVIIREGFDGEYGQIKVFQPDEIRYLGSQESLFDASASFRRPAKRQLIHFDLAEYRRLEEKGQQPPAAAEPAAAYSQEPEGPLQGLNPEQRQAAAHFTGPAAVMAGPGTGKTRVLTRRITHLIDEKQVEPRQILAITFTNKAAGEMQQRCKELIGNHLKAEELTIATFHAFGYRFLKQHASLTGRTSQFSILEEKDKQQLIRELFDLSGQQAKSYARKFRRIKQLPQGMPHDDKDMADQAFPVYQRHLEGYDLFDLDDLIYQTVRILEENPSLREEMAGQHPWMLVDEFQDINHMQYRLLQLISDQVKAPNLFVIGDPNQAIYGFRGSSTRFIPLFLQDHHETKQYTLHTSYRCSANILKASADVLNQQGLQGLSEGVKIKIAPQDSEKSEAEYIARTIESLSGGLRFFSMDSDVTRGEGDEQIGSLSDFAILCRTRSQMNTIEKALLDHTIPYQSVAREAFFNHTLVKEILYILEYTQKPENPFLQKKSSRSLHNYTENDPVGHTLKNLTTVREKVEKLTSRIHPKNKQHDHEEIQQKLLDIAASFGQSTEDFIRYLKLGSPEDAYENQTEKVTLMTLHASKGLEFKCVFIAGCEEGLIPYSLFKDQDNDREEESNREEEKRLLYVGMTRAESYLYLTHARKRLIMGHEKIMNRSPFLNQIEKELTEVAQNTYQKKKQEDSQLKLF